MRTFVTQSRMASLMASLSVRVPEVTVSTVAPSNCIRNTFECLTADILLAHIDDALEAKHGAYGGAGYTVLTRARFSNDALLAHSPCEQALAMALLILWRTRMPRTSRLR